MLENIIDDLWNFPGWALVTTSDYVHDLTGFRCQFDEAVTTSRMVGRQRIGRGIPGRVVNVPGRRAPIAPRSACAPAGRPMATMGRPMATMGGGFGSFIARG